MLALKVQLVGSDVGSDVGSLVSSSSGFSSSEQAVPMANTVTKDQNFAFITSPSFVCYPLNVVNSKNCNSKQVFYSAFMQNTDHEIVCHIVPLFTVMLQERTSP